MRCGLHFNEDYGFCVLSYDIDLTHGSVEVDIQYLEPLRFEVFTGNFFALCAFLS